MKTYKCDKCGEDYLTESRTDDNCCCDRAEVPGMLRPESPLRYRVANFLEQCGDFCPDCSKDLYQQVHLLMKFLIKKD